MNPNISVNVDNSKLRLYKELAEFYFAIEKVHRNFNDELDFINEHFPQNNFHKLVDLGCGTGEHVNALQEKGYETLGIDKSQKMLAVARKRFPRIRVIHDDMSNLMITGVFDAFFSLFGTMNYLLEDLVFKRTLKSIYNRLKKNGLLLMDLWNAEPLRKIKSKPMVNVSSLIYDGKVIHRNRGFELVEKSASTIVKVNYLYQIDDSEMEDCHYMRAFLLPEAEKLIKNSGFFISNIYKNYRKEPFQKTSNRIVIICEKG